MRLIATLPPPYLMDALQVIAGHSAVSGARFNVGARSPWNPLETLRRIQEVMGDKQFYVDLKGRQLRITEWATPTFGDIVLNHEIEVRTPAEIMFRGAGRTFIREVRGNRIFVQPNPTEAVGAGQSVNIHGDGLKIKGYLTEEDRQYVLAAKELGVHDYMLSFVEEESDLEEVAALDSEARIVAKIESPRGLVFVQESYPKYRNSIQLMAARDDLFTNIGDDQWEIFTALRLILTQDPEAIVASKLLESFTRSEKVSLPDLSDLQLMDQLGFQNFMLSDEVCFGSQRGERSFLDAVEMWEQYLVFSGKEAT